MSDKILAEIMRFCNLELSACKVELKEYVKVEEYGDANWFDGKKQAFESVLRKIKELEKL